MGGIRCLLASIRDYSVYLSIYLSIYGVCDLWLFVIKLNVSVSPRESVFAWDLSC